MGKVVQPLQSVNCHDSLAHSLERHGPFTRLVGFGWDGSGLSLVGLVHGLERHGLFGEAFLVISLHVIISHAC
jgi:hypothetical protein